MSLKLLNLYTIVFFIQFSLELYYDMYQWLLQWGGLLVLSEWLYAVRVKHMAQKTAA